MNLSLTHKPKRTPKHWFQCHRSRAGRTNELFLGHAQFNGANTAAVVPTQATPES